jgi:hypothetical protein
MRNTLFLPRNLITLTHTPLSTSSLAQVLPRHKYTTLFLDLPMH